MPYLVVYSQSTLRLVLTSICPVKVVGPTSIVISGWSNVHTMNDKNSVLENKTAFWKRSGVNMLGVASFVFDHTVGSIKFRSENGN